MHQKESVLKSWKLKHSREIAWTEKLQRSWWKLFSKKFRKRHLLDYFASFPNNRTFRNRTIKVVTFQEHKKSWKASLHEPSKFLPTLLKIHPAVLHKRTQFIVGKNLKNLYLKAAIADTTSSQNVSLKLIVLNFWNLKLAAVNPNWSKTKWRNNNKLLTKK